MNILIPGFKDILTLLVKHEVSFLIVGGYAVIFHGYNRTTNDLDIWIKPDNKNKANLINALKEYGIEDQDLQQLSTLDLDKAKFFFIGQKPERIDFLTQLSQVSFDATVKNADYFPLDDMNVPVIDLKNLILSKITNKRSQDKADVEMLQKISKHKGNS